MAVVAIVVYVSEQSGYFPVVNSAQPISNLYAEKQSDVQVQGKGIVVKVLADDLQGSRHQRFILKTADGLSLLVAHNIDLAPRLAGLKKGDKVSFYGEYEWNQRGGIIHWTHDDPGRRHEDGWLKYKGRIYQ